jgi:DNA polymerase-1
MLQPLILIDGMSLVFRAYHALQRTGMKSQTGEPSFAVFAFANILTSLLDKHNPDAIAVVFDTKEPTFRHIMYPEYKAHRDAFPEDLVPQLGRIKELIGLMGLECVELPGFEADDIIGTIARRESADGHDVLCVTSDKDYFQLVTDKVRILRPGKDVGEYEPFDSVRVREKFGVAPEHVVDVLALIGDSSDNVPGVKGVGEKTAIPLIERFGSLEAVYDQIDAIEKASLRTKLEEHRDMAFLSKKLVTIDCDVPVDAKRLALVRKPMNFSAIDTFCADMGFGQLRRKFLRYAELAGVDVDTSIASSTEDMAAMPAHSGPLATLASVPHVYTLVQDMAGLHALVDALRGASRVSVDLETTSLDAMQCAIVGIAMCREAGRAWYVAVDDTSDNPPTGLFDVGERSGGLRVDDAIQALRPILEDPAIGKVGQNLKFDSLILRRYGIVLGPIAFDTMLASYVLDPDQRHNLDALAQRWLNYEPIPITTLIGERKGAQLSMRDVDPARIAEYAGEDVDVAWKLMEAMEPVLEQQGLTALARDIEFRTEEVLTAMEFNGVAIDTSALNGLAHFMREEAARLETLIHAEAGEPFNIASPKQLAEILFERMMLPAPKKTKTGYSTDASVLTELAESFPIAGYVLEYRQVEKLRSTYVETLPRLINPHTGRVHTTYNQTVAATGRLSSTDPNLQNIPVRTELGQQIRKAFVPQHAGHVIFSADYSQIELRIMASMAGDAGLTEAFANGLDVHAATASGLFDVPIDAITSDQRRIAKTVNFGIMYGQGAFGLAQQLGLSRGEAQGIIDRYFAAYAGIKSFIDRTVEETRDRGYASTMCGRRRYFPAISSNNRGLRTAAERAAVNMPIQGTAADMMKLAMIRVFDRMKAEGLQSLLMMQVHDELVFEAREDEVDALRRLVVTEMEAALPLPGVPVRVDTGVGSSWYEAH